MTSTLAVIRPIEDNVKDPEKPFRSFTESGYVPLKDAVMEPADYQEYVVVDRKLFENSIAHTIDWMNRQAFPIRMSRVNTSYPATLLISGPRSAVRRVRQIINHNSKLNPGELVAIEGEKPNWIIRLFTDITNQQVGEVTSVNGARSNVRPIRGTHAEMRTTSTKERDQITRVPQFIGVKMQRELDVVKHQWERDREYHYFTKQMDQLERRDLSTISRLEKRLESCKTSEAEAERFRIQCEMQRGELTELRAKMRQMEERLRQRESELAQARLETEVSSRKQREGKAELDTLRIEVDKQREEARIAQQKATDSEIHNTTQMTLLKRRTMELDSVCDRLTASNLEKRRAGQELQKARWKLQDAVEEINRLRGLASLPPTATPIPEKHDETRKSAPAPAMAFPLMRSPPTRPQSGFGLQAPPQGVPPRRRRRESVFDRVELSTQIGLPIRGASGLSGDPVATLQEGDPEPPRLTATALRQHTASFSYLPQLDRADRDILNPPLSLPNRQVLQSPNSDMKTQPRTPKAGGYSSTDQPGSAFPGPETKKESSTPPAHQRQPSNFGQTYKPPPMAMSQNSGNFNGVMGAAAELGIDLRKDFGGARGGGLTGMGIIPDNKSSEISTPTASEASGDAAPAGAAPASQAQHRPGRGGGMFGSRFSWSGNEFGQITGAQTAGNGPASPADFLTGQATEDKPPAAPLFGVAPSAPPAGPGNRAAGAGGRRPSTMDEMMLADMLGAPAAGSTMAGMQRMDSPFSNTTTSSQPVTSWQCQMCTFENQVETAVCEMCSTGRRPDNLGSAGVEDKPVGGMPDWGFAGASGGADWDDDVEELSRSLFFKLTENFPSSTGGASRIDATTGLEWAEKIIGFGAAEANAIWNGQGAVMSMPEWQDFMEEAVGSVNMGQEEFKQHCTNIISTLETPRTVARSFGFGGQAAWKPPGGALEHGIITT